MVLLVRLEHLTILVLAERLSQQPVGLLRILPVMLVIGLISETGEFHSVSKLQTISKLLRFSGQDIECREPELLQIDAFAVLQLMQQDICTNTRKILLLQRHLRHCQQHILYHIMAVDMKLAAVFAFVHEVCNFAYDPDYAKDMIGMTMCHKHMMAPLVIKAGDLQLPENPIATASIRQKEAVILQFQIKTGIKAPGCHSKPCT